MNVLLNRSIMIKSIIVGIAILSLKNFVFKKLSVWDQDLHGLIEFSDNV